MPSSKTSQVASLFEALLDPRQFKAADTELQQFLSQDSQASEILLEILLSETSFQDVVRGSAAIQLKNIVKKQYTGVLKEKPSHIQSFEILTKIDKYIFSSESLIQDQVCIIVGIIADTLEENIDPLMSEFGKYLETLVSRVRKNPSPDVLYGFYNVINSISGNITKEGKSDELYMRILTFQAFFCPIFFENIESLLSNINIITSLPQETCSRVIEILSKLCNSAYNLVYHDLLQFFEENLSRLLIKLKEILEFNPQNLDEQLSIEILSLKSEVMNCINFIHRQYISDVKETKVQFTDVVYNLMRAPQHDSDMNDLLYAKYLNFLSIVSVNSDFKAQMQSPQMIESLCVDIIMPNIKMSNSDQEAFNDSPSSYLNKDLISFGS
ncbi:MAG: importin-alpha export receptor [Paramarteilia canceri]